MLDTGSYWCIEFKCFTGINIQAFFSNHIYRLSSVFLNTNFVKFRINCRFWSFIQVNILIVKSVFPNGRVKVTIFSKIDICDLILIKLVKFYTRILISSHTYINSWRLRCRNCNFRIALIDPRHRPNHLRCSWSTIR